MTKQTKPKLKLNIFTILALIMRAGALLVIGFASVIAKLSSYILSEVLA